MPTTVRPTGSDVGRVTPTVSFVTFAMLVGTALVPAAEKEREPRNGLKAEVFAGGGFERLAVSRVDERVDWFWDFARPADGVSNDWFTVRWTGWLKAPRPGRYKLVVDGDDAARLWLDGVQLIDRWGRGGRHEASVELSGRPQELRLEYGSGRAPNWFSFHWIPPKGIEVVVPAEALFPTKEAAEAKGSPEPPPVPAGSGLQCDYYRGTEFQRKVRAEVVTKVGAVWGDGAPDDMPADNFSIRWTGWIKAPKPGRYQVRAYANDGVRLWIDRQKVIDKWPGGNIDGKFFDFGTEPVLFEMHSFHGGGHASVSLAWTPPEAAAPELIPPTAFFRTKAAALKGNRP